MSDIYQDEQNLGGQDDISKNKQPENNDIDKPNDEPGKATDGLNEDGQRMVENAMGNIINEAKQVGDYPKWMQGHLTKRLEKAEQSGTSEVERNNIDVQTQVKSELQKEKNDVAFNNIADTLSESDKEIFSQELNELEGYGVPRERAIELARGKVTVQGAVLPRTGQPMAPKTFGKISIDQFDNLQQGQKLEYIKKSEEEFGEVIYN